MGTWLHGSTVVEWVADLIRDDAIFTTLELVHVSHGRLRQVATDPTMSDNVPCVLVSLTDLVPVDAANVGRNLETRYPVRVAYVRQFADSEKVVQTKEEALETIGNLLMDSRSLTAISLTAGKVINARLMSVEYDPEEEDELAALGKNLKACALTFEVWIISTGS